MKTTKNVRKWAAEQGIAAKGAFRKGIEAESKESVKKGAEICVKA
jgi:hypothetical protein